MSNSLLGYLGSPRSAWWYYHHGKSADETPKLGNSVHHALLGTAKLIGLNRNNGKDKAKIPQAEADGYTVIPRGDYDKCAGIVDFLHSTPLWADVLRLQPEFEEPWFGEWVDAQGRTWRVKCKPDIRLKAVNALIDIKTVADASAAEMHREIDYRGLGRQAAWYLEMTGCAAYFVLAIETKPPYHSEYYLVACRDLQDPDKEWLAHNRFNDFRAELPGQLQKAAALVATPNIPTLAIDNYVTI